MIAPPPMVAKGTPLPDRIEPDAITEALFEVRFDLVAPLPEVLFGRLSELPQWKGFTQQRRLPAYEMPSLMREGDPNLRYVPVLELASPDPRRAVRIGAHVLSYHLLAPYTGWGSFQSELHVAIDGLFEKTEGLVATRLGLRYINALSPEKHGISSISQLDLRLEVSQAPVTDHIVFNFTTNPQNQTVCRVSVATRDFVQGEFPADAIALVDVDVGTTPDFQTNSREAVKAWAAEARNAKNQAFLGLLSEDTLAKLGRNSH
jgi:uncharacterized protein (TIGR04255 family)